jgi:hypothetical protein
MGFLRLFSKAEPKLLRLPSGSFTVDREGKVLVRTLPSSYPMELVEEIGRQMLEAFREAAAAQLPLSEIVVNYSSLKITARELRGGAIVFLAAKAPSAKAHLSSPERN